MTTLTKNESGVQDDRKTKASPTVSPGDQVPTVESEPARVIARVKSQRTRADRHINSLPLRERIAQLRKEGKL